MKNRILTAFAVVGGLTIAAALAPQRLMALIGSPMEIFNAVSHWVPVRDVDHPARAFVYVSPVTQTVHSSFVLTPMMTVPAGKTLVIEDVSGHCDATIGIGYAYLVVKNGNMITNSFFPGSIAHGNASRWAFHALTRAYVPAGGQVSLGFDGSVDNASQTLFCAPSLSGYLVDSNWNNALN